MKILLSNASSLTSRQLATLLSRSGHEVHVLSGTPGPTLCSFTSCVKKVHRVPDFGTSARHWLDGVWLIIDNGRREDNLEHGAHLGRRRPFDLLVAAGDEVAILSTERGRIEEELGVKIAVPSFQSVERAMSRISACKTLTQAHLPQPEYIVLEDLNAIDSEGAADLLPAYLCPEIRKGAPREVRIMRQLRDAIKDLVVFGDFEVEDITIKPFPSSRGRSRGESIPIPISTSSSSSSARDLNKGKEVVKKPRPRLLLQKSTPGSRVMITAVFSHGNLLLWHAVVRVHEGPGGGAAKKISLPLPIIETDLRALGIELQWHGALSLDAILVNQVPSYIDIHPYIMEPFNAWLSGVNLVDALLDVSFDDEEHMAKWAKVVDGTEKITHGTEGVETHQLVMAFLDAAMMGRGWLCVEVFKALMGFETYAWSQEELTPLEADWAWSLWGLSTLVWILMVGGAWAGERASEWLLGDGYTIRRQGWRGIMEQENEKEKEKKKGRGAG